MKDQEKLESNVKSNEKLIYYKSLLEFTYDELVNFLLEKYGGAIDNYFKESSYEKALKGEIKSIEKGQISRTDEGLYCHHIDENKNILLSSQNDVIFQKSSFEFQKKERLVYCDLVEHLILHALISKETKGQFGCGGYNTYLEPTVKSWFIEGKLPSIQYMKICYEKVFLSKDDAKSLLKYISNMALKEVKKEQKRREEEISLVDGEKVRREWLLTIEKEIMSSGDEERISKWKTLVAKQKKEKQERLEKEEAEKLQLERLEKKALDKFIYDYPELIELGIHPKSSRQQIINCLYKIKYYSTFSKRKDFQSSKINLLTEELFEELKKISREI